MDFKFDYLKQLKDPESYLCNPDKRQISVIETRSATLTLRFNDLSELAFETPFRVSNSRGELVEYPHYDRIETKRLILLEGVGYFRISSVTETDDGQDKYKSVKAESLQAVFKDRGFYIEQRLYKFYNPYDPMDEKYDASDDSAIPSVVGQLYQQLGIRPPAQVQEQDSGENEGGYGEWTITHISPALKHYDEQENNIARSFTEAKATYGYDFMVNTVEEAFNVIFIFDFLRQSIRVEFVEDITQRTNIYFSFDNLMNELQTEERADDIVTVLNCNGSNLDIRAINPTGTNYITDFSYYMDEAEYQWMSKGLIDKLKEWQAAVEEKTPEWADVVLALRALYQTNSELKAVKVLVDKKLQDLEDARDQYIKRYTDKEMTGDEIVTAEDIPIGGGSLDDTSMFKSIAFDKDQTHTCYKGQPRFDAVNGGQGYITGTFSFSDKTPGETAGGTFDENYLGGTYAGDYNDGYIYFADGDAKSYCALYGKADVPETEEGSERAEYHVVGFIRYTIYSNIPHWISIYQKEAADLQAAIDDNNGTIETVTEWMRGVSSGLNLLKFLAATPELLKELKEYWVEGDYENQGFAVYDNTTMAEGIDLARELMESGKKELEKICQPRFSIQVSAADFTKLYAFKAFSGELELGKVITVERAGGKHYYPALTSMSFSLNDADSFELIFSNKLKLNDWGYTYADLIATASDTSRTVSANWQDLTSFARQEHDINELLYNPLNRTLRLAQGRMSNQEFTVDDKGILGRRYDENDESRSAFEPEQIRIINNVLLFTNDHWQTAKTALGKISYTHPVSGQQATAYGLLAEAVVGSLIIGNMLYLSNEDNTIRLDAAGISIDKKEGGASVNVFKAMTNGNVYIKGEIAADSGKIGGLTIAGSSIYSDNGIFSVNADGLLKTKSGEIGGWRIETDRLSSGSGGTYVGIGSGGTYSFWAGDSSPSASPFYVTNNGSINAAKGYIGYLSLKSGRLFSGDFVLGTNTDNGVLTTSLQFGTTDTDGNIIGSASTSIDVGKISTPVLDATKSVVTPRLDVGALTLRYSTIGGASTNLMFEESIGGSSVQYTATLSYTGGALGNVIVHVKLDKTLQTAKSFAYTYKYVGGGTSYNTQTIAAGSSSSSYQHAYCALGVASLYFTENSATTYSFTQSSGGGGMGILVTGTLEPWFKDRDDLGSSSFKWKNLWAVNVNGQTTTPSDGNNKHDINDVDEVYSVLFDDLKPKTFKYNDGTSGRTHIGLIAGELKESLDKLNITTQDFAAYCSWETEEGGEECGIRYGELIPLCILEIQKLKSQIKALIEYK